MTHRTILEVYDVDTGDMIPVEDLLDSSEENVHRLRSEITACHQSGADRYFCRLCKGSVWPCIDKGRYFKHYSPVDPSCDWYTGDPKKTRDIDRQRFQGLTEGPLHQRLKQFIFEMLEKDDRFHNVVGDLKFIIDPKSGLRRKPDVSGQFKERKIVFELQLSRTYLKDIVGRQEFYKTQGTYIAWIFHDFVNFRENATARDIFYTNHTNALELDKEAEEASLEAGVLKLKAHWYGFDMNRNGLLVEGWNSRLVDLDELHWDPHTFKPRYVEPEEQEYQILSTKHADWKEIFESSWMQRHEKNGRWQRKAFKAAWARFEEHVTHHPLPTFDVADDASFEKVLDELYALKHGRVFHSGHNEVAALNHALENWGGFTQAIIAVALAYGRDDLLDTATAQKKISENFNGSSRKPKQKQHVAFEPVIKFLFPESVPYFLPE